MVMCHRGDGSRLSSLLVMEHVEAHICIISSATALLLLELLEPSEGSGLRLPVVFLKADILTLSMNVTETRGVLVACWLASREGSVK